jgi:hypothetical protein
VTIEEAALAASSLVALTGGAYSEARPTLRAMAETAFSRRRAHGVALRAERSSVMGAWERPRPSIRASLTQPCLTAAELRRPRPLLDVEQHENASNNGDVQDHPDNGDRILGIPLFGRGVLSQGR